MYTSQNEYIQPVRVLSTLQDAAGDNLPEDFDSSPEAYGYNNSSQVTTITRTASDGHTYVQTFTYSGGNLTNVSKWVRAS